MSSQQDMMFMRRALELAEKGRGSVSPNPMVGCVIVHDGIVIGEGWHQKYGEAHAEVNAIESVSNQEIIGESTCYVTLEPCSHQGKTPPCSDLLIERGLKRVVIGCADTNPLVGGKGIQKLKQAGVEVEVGVLENECRTLNRRFFTLFEKGRPYLILKWAQTSDGFIARKNYDSKWISNEESRTLVHQWRAEEDAILVGTNTAKYDNPTLNVRDWVGNDPVRVVIDKNLSLDPNLNLFSQGQPTLVFNTIKDEPDGTLEFIKTDFSRLEENILKELSNRKIQSVIIEGGSKTIMSWVEKGLWDEARVFTSPTTFDEGIVAPTLKIEAREKTQLQNDILEIYYNE